MTGTTPWQAQDAVEPIQADTIGAIANMAGFNTVSGCGATYSISTMDITIAAGTVTHTSAITTVAGNTVTLVSDPTNPRWTYQYVNSSGVAAIVSGTAAATPAVPDFGANVTGQLVYVQANLTIAGNATYKLDKRVFNPSNTLATSGLTYKYKSATQVFTTNTAYADVTAASGNFAFSVVANGVYLVEFYLPITTGGTGGVKFQLTGPAAPTSVVATALAANVNLDASAGVAAIPPIVVGSYISGIFQATAFSSTIMGVNSASTGTDNTINGGANFPVRITALIANGANAGTVTLQAAQNSSNSTTTLGVGSWMKAERIA